MKRYLADVNVWFALAVAEHQHHHQARQFWEETPGVFGFVRTTQLGLLRLLTSAGPPMAGHPLTNQQAWAVWDGFLAHDRVRIFPDLPALEDQFRALSSSSQPSSKVWVDAYLAALAVANDATLVTFDQAFARYNVPCRILS